MRLAPVPPASGKTVHDLPGAGLRIEDRFAIFIEELKIPAEKLRPEARLKEDVGADELDLVELVMATEEEFDIEISDDDAEKITTVGDLTKYVSAKVK